MTTELPLSKLPPSSLLRSISEWVWGYDFFVSYDWKSGGAYAVELVERLREEGFDCFLDRSEFAFGDDWQQEAARALRNTQRLIVVATREAVTTSKAVGKEVHIFSDRKDHIIPIVFADPYPDGQLFAGGKPFEPKDYKTFPTLSFFPNSKLYIKEDFQFRTKGPGQEVVKKLKSTEGILRRRILRRRLVLSVIAFLATAAIVSLVFYFLANAARKTAERRLNDLGSLTEATVFELHDIIQALPGAVRHRERLVERSIPFLETLAKEKPTDEATLRFMAVAHLKLGDVLGHPENFNLGKQADAITSWTKARHLVDDLKAQHPDTDYYLQLEASLFERTGLVSMQNGNLDAAKVDFEQGHKLLSNRQASSEDWESDRSSARLLMRIGDVQRSQKTMTEARQSFLSAFDLQLRNYKQNPDNRLLASDLAASFSRLAEVDFDEGLIDDALNKANKAISHREILEKDEPYDAKNLTNLIGLHDLRGRCLRRLLKYEDALVALENAAELSDRLYQHEPANIVFAFNLATHMEQLGKGYTTINDWENAIESFEYSKEIRKELNERDPNNEEYLHHFALSLEQVADTYRIGLEDPGVLQEEIEADLKQALMIRKRLFAEYPNNLVYRRALAGCKRLLGRVYLDTSQRPEEMISLLREASRLFVALKNDYPQDPSFTRDAGTSLCLLADGLNHTKAEFDQVLETQKAGLAIVRKAVSDHPDRVDIVKTLMVAEQRVADFLNTQSAEQANPQEVIAMAKSHYDAVLDAITKLEERTDQVAGLDNLRNEVQSKIEDCKKALRNVKRE